MRLTRQIKACLKAINGRFTMLLLLLALLWQTAGLRAQTAVLHQVAAGDSWTALAWRYGLTAGDKTAVFPHINSRRQPAIGTTLQLPPTASSRAGHLERVYAGGLLQTAVRRQRNPWQLAWENGLESPYHPLSYQPIFIAGGRQPPLDLPPGVTGLMLSQIPARPGQALAVRAETSVPLPQAAAYFDSRPLDLFVAEQRWLALGATGAFFGSGEPELVLQSAPGQPLWVQPWRVQDGEWSLQQITLTGSAAAIDQATIAAERERLFALWTQVSSQPLWDEPFQLPITQFLTISSAYGTRRSYNGGPYRTYHEGVDFSAYAGTAVTAPAAGQVVLAEFLAVRGGAVILDHGLGIYSGYYHLSDIAVAVGDRVQPGQLLGEVGTTGLSTGNHLHWDLLVNGTWVDAAAWVEQDMACWLLAGLGRSC